MTIRAVVFDVGGVLEKVEDPRHLFERWRRRLGLEPAELAAAVDSVDPDGDATVGRLTEAELRHRYVRALGLSESSEQQFMAELWDWYCGKLDYELVDFVASLRPAYTTAILSNSADGARREEQARYGFEDLVDVVLYSHELGLAKPDPRIFHLACARLGVEPGEMVFLDDVPEIVDAAARLGIHAVLHRSTPESTAAISSLLAR